jgi:Fe-S-cluster containining protein
MTPEQYAPLKRKPSFLNVIQASETPCLGCTGECCRARVVMNIPDLVRLAAPLGIHPSALCDLTECETRNATGVLIGETAKYIQLRKRDDGFCRLLLEIDGHRRCGVHSLRPSICRIYPFSFERGSSVYAMGLVVCPTQWIVSAHKRDAILDDVESFEQDRALDRRLVKRFNRLPEGERTPAAFWLYAMVEGGRELGLDVSYLSQQAPRRQLKPALW